VRRFMSRYIHSCASRNSFLPRFDFGSASQRSRRLWGLPLAQICKKDGDPLSAFQLLECLVEEHPEGSTEGYVFTVGAGSSGSALSPLLPNKPTR
jgi:hypothetical protein